MLYKLTCDVADVTETYVWWTSTNHVQSSEQLTMSYGSLLPYTCRPIVNYNLLFFCYVR